MSPDGICSRAAKTARRFQKTSSSSPSLIYVVRIHRDACRLCTNPSMATKRDLVYLLAVCNRACTASKGMRTGRTAQARLPMRDLPDFVLNTVKGLGRAYLFHLGRPSVTKG